MMYNLHFQEKSAFEIAKAIHEQGYFIFENSLTEEYIDDMIKEIEFNKVLVNINDLGVVVLNNQKFLTHCLAKSKKAYDLITSQKVLEICQEYFQDRYQLINHRICQTFNYSYMPWHTDNNLQTGTKLSGKHNMPGLLFLFYLSDIDKSPFQYIKDSHHWSQQYDEIYFDDSWINKNYQKDILTFPMKKGGLIVCNIHGIHRAKPFRYENYTRTLLLFQVDGVGSENIGHGEQNLINSDFIDNFSPEISSYLGFGRKRDYPAFPNSSAETMQLQDIVTLQTQLLSLFIKGFSKTLIKTILSESLMINIKRKAWKFNKFNR